MKRGFHALAIDEHRHDFTPTFWTGTLPQGAAIEQVWFVGAHSDVGGGYTRRSLADTPLVWMAKQAESQVSLSIGNVCPILLGWILRRFTMILRQDFSRSIAIARRCERSA
jgi:hypothetical protein